MNMPVLAILNNSVNHKSPNKTEGKSNEPSFAQAMVENRREKPLSKNIIKESKPKHEEGNPLQALAMIIDTKALPLIKGKAENKMVTDGNQSLKPDTDKHVQATNTERQLLKPEIALGRDDLIKDKKIEPAPLLTINNSKDAKINNAKTDKLIKNERLKLSPHTDIKAETKRTNKPDPEIAKPTNEQIKITIADAPVAVKSKFVIGDKAQTGQASNIENQILLTGQQDSKNVQNLGLSRQINLSTHFNSPNWAQEFGKQIVNLGQSQSNSGQIVQMHVNPPELGPVHISLHLNDGAAQATFISPHANVRHAIENALPNLQEEMNQAGISLGETNISDQPAPEQQNQQGSKHSTFSHNPGQNLGAVNSTQESNTINRPRADGLIDTFA